MKGNLTRIASISRLALSGSDRRVRDKGGLRPEELLSLYSFANNYTTMCYGFEFIPFQQERLLVEASGRKWNLTENGTENAKNRKRNPLIFREIPRNYGSGELIFDRFLRKIFSQLWIHPKQVVRLFPAVAVPGLPVPGDQTSGG